MRGLLKSLLGVGSILSGLIVPQYSFAQYGGGPDQRPHQASAHLARATVTMLTPPGGVPFTSVSSFTVTNPQYNFNTSLYDYDLQVVVSSYNSVSNPVELQLQFYNGLPPTLITGSNYNWNITAGTTSSGTAALITSNFNGKTADQTMISMKFGGAAGMTGTLGAYSGEAHGFFDCNAGQPFTGFKVFTATGTITGFYRLWQWTK